MRVGAEAALDPVLGYGVGGEIVDPVREVVPVWVGVDQGGEGWGDAGCVWAFHLGGCS